MLSNSWQTAVRVKAMATLATLMRAMTKRSTNHMPSNQPLPSLRRAFSLYDQINLINNVPEDQLRFQQFTDTGFRVNGAHYEGSLLCVGNLLMSWQPKNLSEVTPESLSIFQTVRPVPEILLLGCGKYIQPVNPERNAASTYNILNEEGRIVAAALLPYGIES
ncbi:NADH dehydrogenase [ubiquinone] 1 alpha subcomplex assembly factor 3 isoform X2 [Capsicum annuum]|uniref:NADH dehydrogenase [ubiquinone] 1 alpha subcomplex assembly factor 3 isoform X2 n=1 Tax=Capsicum annuum TaxID=4072 RepID=UPI0007BFD7FF|nr:NADH dehydrogenase [ubiquinone] 1 alpha subcomplex assembly factor 3 isoform X2 [Capsicum annuum]